MVDPQCLRPYYGFPAYADMLVRVKKGNPYLLFILLTTLLLAISSGEEGGMSPFFERALFYGKGEFHGG